MKIGRTIRVRALGVALAAALVRVAAWPKPLEAHARILWNALLRGDADTIYRYSPYSKRRGSGLTEANYREAFARLIAPRMARITPVESRRSR